MKTLKTQLGIKQIEDHDTTLIPLLLQDVLHEYRSSLIDKLLTGLDTYIKWKFNTKATKSQLETTREALFKIKLSPLKIDNYTGVLEQLLKSDFVNLDSNIFYSEIDTVIQYQLGFIDMSEKQHEPWETPTFNNKDFRVFIRKQMITEIQTEEGLKKYILDRYEVDIKDKAKILYLLQEVQEFYKKEPIDTKWIHEFFNEYKLGAPEEGNKFILDKEMSDILKNHF